MERVRKCDLPANALSQRHRASGDYTDCFCTRIARDVRHPEFVEAFYTTRLFQLERWILARFVALPSTDAEAKALALGERVRFAAWTVEERAPDQVLLRDFTGCTHACCLGLQRASWPQVQPRNRNIRISTGIGIPSSHNRMYPILPPWTFGLLRFRVLMAHLSASGRSDSTRPAPLPVSDPSDRHPHQAGAEVPTYE